MKTRAEIIVKGRVQRVGYRDFAAEIANELGIGGFTENLPDGNVRIIAEGEKETLEKFIKILKPKDDPMIKVIDVTVKFAQPTGEFEYFDIKYGNFDEEGFERIGVAAMHLKHLVKGQNEMLGKQDQMLEKQDQTIEKIGNLTTTTQDSFNTLNIKYDIISQNMNRIFEELVRERKETRQSIKELVGAILKSKS
ncbi:MAG: hypothetical protein MSIBF_04690 [Candidatus Altiarchaeales archaeon IMC4]|nr:MAG: hypothetical protein MSIBF_04690 [Candidatus Altiarchaeales archaeon IMC4]